MAFFLARLLLGWTFALPIHLFEAVRPADALRSSTAKSKEHVWVILPVMAGWAVGSMVVSGLTLGFVGLVGRSILPMLGGSVTLLVMIIGILVLLWGAANLIVTLLSASSFALLIVRLYDRMDVAAGTTWPAETLEPIESGSGLRLSRGKFMAGVAATTLVALILGAGLLDSIRLDDDVLVIAHRGAAGAAPENTMASFERAIADGTDYVELDVQENADGEVVVIHDSDLMKIGGVNLKIWDATGEQLRDIDVGSWFSPEFSGERVPTLEQVLELCKGRARVNIELKYYGRDESLEERVVEIVERTGMESQIVVMSLKYGGVQRVRQLRPNWTLGLLTAKAVGDLTRLDADFLAVHAGLATARFVRSAHKRGKQIYAWTVNDPVQMFLLMNRGVDGLITDEPALARSVIEQRAELNAVERLMVELSVWFGVKPEQSSPETDAD
jgi:glycerophosphoryl diester phosphodiesterase